MRKTAAFRSTRNTFVHTPAIADAARKGRSKKRVVADPAREIDFCNAPRGAAIPVDPGKTQISIRIDDAVIEHLRGQVGRAGAGNYQTLMNDALLTYLQQKNVIDVVRLVVREELVSSRAKLRPQKARALIA